MKKKIIIFTFLLLQTTLHADNIVVNGISYSIFKNSNEAQVISNRNTAEKYFGSITIPNNIDYEGGVYKVTSIAEGAFSECIDLLSIDLPESICRINEKAFWNCKNLKSIVFGGKLEYIGGYAFSSCSNIQSLTFPESLLTIGKYAFASCLSLKSIKFGKNISNFGDYAFTGCDNLTSIYLSDLTAWCNASFANHFSSAPLQNPCHLYLNNEEITDLIIPDNIETINTWTFRNFAYLHSLTIPESVKYIKIGAFQGCKGLTSIRIGKGIVKFGDNCFKDCESLKDVYCYGRYPANKSGVEMFDGSNIENATLHVPEGTIDEYLKKSPWNEFGSVVTFNEGETGIVSVFDNNSEIMGYYTIGGNRCENNHKGITIVKMKNGKSIKIVR